MIAFKAKSLGLSVAPARLAGTPSRIPTAATMTWRMPLPARRRSPNSADTTPACAGCRATTTAAPPGSASVFKPSSTAGAHPTMTEFCALAASEERWQTAAVRAAAARPRHDHRASSAAAPKTIRTARANRAMIRCCDVKAGAISTHRHNVPVQLELGFPIKIIDEHEEAREVLHAEGHAHRASAGVPPIGIEIGGGAKAASRFVGSRLRDQLWRHCVREAHISFPILGRTPPASSTGRYGRFRQEMILDC